MDRPKGGGIAGHHAYCRTQHRPTGNLPIASDSRGEMLVALIVFVSMVGNIRSQKQGK